ncbi:MAG TPA: HemK family protein methyltransferase [Streptosporangiaceae bacterium]
MAGRLRAAGCVFAEAEADLLLAAASSPAQLRAMVEQRAGGMPLEHVVGWAEFCGLRIAVGPGVFVPRRRTEFLVGLAAGGTGAGRYPAGADPARAAGDLAGQDRPGRPVVIDLCCGSGALGVALAAALGGADLHAADVDPAALAWARRNVVPAGGRVHQGDLFGALPAELRGRADILLVNVPYVPTGEIELLPAEARDHEPRVALDGGGDGLEVLRRVAAEAAAWLAPGGRLLTEASERQAGAAAAIVAAGGLAAQVVSDDELGATVVIGRRS